MIPVNYKILKSIIYHTCEAEKTRTNSFRINYDKLNIAANDINLACLATSMNSKNVSMKDIPFLSEYFEKNRLSWFGKSKDYLVLTFVDTTALDEKGKQLVDGLLVPEADDPGSDHVNDMATIIANYPCYFAVVVSYTSNDPSRMGRLSYEIVCRANKVVIKSSDYQYNSKDMA